jgi:hypothetical protein
MDPINPIPPGPPGFRGQGHLPVDRLERISRERDRPEGDPRRRRRQPPPAPPAEREPPEDGLPHIDVRA